MSTPRFVPPLQQELCQEIRTRRAFERGSKRLKRPALALAKALLLVFVPLRSELLTARPLPTHLAPTVLCPWGLEPGAEDVGRGAGKTGLGPLLYSSCSVSRGLAPCGGGGGQGPAVLEPSLCCIYCCISRTMPGTWWVLSPPTVHARLNTEQETSATPEAARSPPHLSPSRPNGRFPEACFASLGLK